MHYFSTLFSYTTLHVSDRLTIDVGMISIPNSLADSQHTSMTNNSCCECSIKTPDDGRQVCPKHVELFIKIFFYPMPHMSFTDFVVFPPGHGRSVTYF